MAPGAGARLGHPVAETKLQLREARLNCARPRTRDALRHQFSAAPSDAGIAPPPMVATPEIDTRIDLLKKKPRRDVAALHRMPGRGRARRVIEDLEAEEAQLAKLSARAWRAYRCSRLPVVQGRADRLAGSQAEARVASLRARVAGVRGTRLAKLGATRADPAAQTEMAQLNRDYDVTKEQRRPAGIAAGSAIAAGMGTLRASPFPRHHRPADRAQTALGSPTGCCCRSPAWWVWGALKFALFGVAPAFGCAPGAAGLALLSTVLRTDMRRRRRHNRACSPSAAVWWRTPGGVGPPWLRSQSCSC